MNDSPTLTRAQMLFWAGQMLDPDTPLYNMAVNVLIHGEIDAERFERALRNVISRSDAMMSTFDASAAIPARNVEWDREWALEHVDLSNASDPMEAANRWANDRVLRPFPLDGLLFESALLRVDAHRYIWYLNQHHLITDAWSTSILFKRVSEAYESDSAPILPAFDDYVQFEHAARPSGTSKAVGPPPPSLYGMSASENGTASRRVRIALGPYRSEQIRAVIQEPDVRCLTPHLAFFNVFATFLFAFLHRISGQSSLAIGAPAHNRPTLQFRETPGVFIELYPLIAEVSGAESFQTLLDKLKVETTEFLRHATPGTSQPEANRCFNTVLNYINASFGEFAGYTTETDWLHSGHNDRGHTLRLLVYDFDASGEFILEFDASTDAFDKDLLSRMPGHFLSIVDAFLADRLQAIASIDLLSSDEGMQLDDFGTGEPTTEPPATLSELVLANVGATPDQLAVSSPDGRMTYAELESASRKVAETLEQQSVQRGSAIPIVGDAGSAWIAGVIGILRHGSAYVPVSLQSPPERARAILEDANAELVLFAGNGDLPFDTDSDVIDLAAIIGSEVCALPNDYDHAVANAPAYVLYTSGSTGRPKGVQVPHRAVTNLISYNERLAPLQSPAHCVLWTDVGFDVSIYEVFTALAFGHALLIPASSVRIDGEALFSFWNENGIVSGYVPPFLLPELDQWIDQYAFSAKRFLVGVEPIPHALLVSIARKCPGLKIINGYGPTEATVCATLFVVDPENSHDGAAPVGRPIANTRCWLLDSAGMRCPLGAVGELWISGEGLAEGYFNDPDLTERYFREVEIDSVRVRAYRTGDAMRFRPEGTLEFVGRLDKQLKFRGVRIEPAEIQSAVLASGSIEACAVKVAPSGELIAYLVAPGEIEPTTLRQLLRERLPEAVIPSYLVQVDAIPRTENGKIDFAALPEPDTGSATGSSATQPDGPVEEIVVGIFSELLGREHVGIDRTFIELGGDSLFAMRALAQINQEFDLQLLLQAMFRSPTVRELSKLITERLIEEVSALDDAEAERQVNS